jgi:hypothetical protein
MVIYILLYGIPHSTIRPNSAFRHPEYGNTQPTVCQLPLLSEQTLSRKQEHSYLSRAYRDLYTCSITGYPHCTKLRYNNMIVRKSDRSYGKHVLMSGTGPTAPMLGSQTHLIGTSLQSTLVYVDFKRVFFIGRDYQLPLRCFPPMCLAARVDGEKTS